MNDDNVAGDASARRREDEAAAAAALVGVAHQPRLHPAPAVAAPAQPQQHHHHLAAGAADAASSGSHANYIPRSPSDRQCLTWRRMPPSPNGILPPPRSGAASVVVKGRLYVFGGYGGGTGRLDDFFSYNFETGCWEEVPVLSSEKPGPRENNGVVISDGSQCIYLFGVSPPFGSSSWKRLLSMHGVSYVARNTSTGLQR
jgi:Kelch motif